MTIKKAIKILKQEWNEYEKKNDEVIKKEQNNDTTNKTDKVLQ